MKKMYLSKDGLTLKRVTKNSEGDIVIPEGVVYLAKRALAGCEFITEVSLPSTLKEIGEEAFDGCTSFGSEIHRLAASAQDLRWRSYARERTVRRTPPRTGR